MKITVQKFDPAVDEAPYYIEGEVEYLENMSAMEALIEFHETVEPVAFDYNCVAGRCGRCGMKVDGEPVLICGTPIDDSDHTFEPLDGFDIVRDLIVDRTAYREHYQAVLDRRLVEPLTDDATAPNFDYSKQDMQLALERCARCGICDSVCPVRQEMPTEYAGPGIMMAHAYRCMDEFDPGNRIAEVVADGLYRCILCGKCDEVCPNSTSFSHLEIYEYLRNKAEEAGLKPSYAE